MAYLDLAGFSSAGGTVMPLVLVNRLETERPGWIAARLEKRSSYIDAKLKKRYAVPFQSPPPLVVVDWLIAIVTLEAYGALGVDLSSEMDKQLIVAPHDEAMKEIDEAAESQNGLFDLPLREDQPGTSAIVKEGAYGYSEASPYAWMDRQCEAAGDGRDE